MTNVARHLERLELAAKTIEVFLQDPSNNRPRDIRAAASYIEELVDFVEQIAGNCIPGLPDEAIAEAQTLLGIDTTENGS